MVLDGRSCIEKTQKIISLQRDDIDVRPSDAKSVLVFEILRPPIYNAHFSDQINPDHFRSAQITP